MRHYLILLTLILPLLTYTQDSWVSISNEFITISMDKTTGRYIVSDNINYHSVSPLKKDFFPNFLTPISTSLNNAQSSPILGNETNAFNVATLLIDGSPVVFGSSSGQWNGEPTITSTSIIYSWKLGTLDIVQHLEIITNTETLFPESVQISYDVFNNNTNQSRKIQSRIVLDPIANDGLNHTFFLPNNQAILTEYESTSGILPPYWLTSDPTGQISALSLQGSLNNTTDSAPQRIYLTTMDRALQDIWEFRYSRNNTLSGKDTAVVLFFKEQNILQSTSKRVASTVINIPSLIDNVSKNGLEVRTSTFINEKTTPAFINLWVQNTNQQFFDSVDLTINLPDSLISYDPIKKTITDVGQGNVFPVSWNIGTDAQLNNDYTLSVNIKGYINGKLSTQFDVPISLSIDPEYTKNNQASLNNVINSTQSNIASVTKTNTTKSNIILLSPFESQDILGSSSESLAKIQHYLQTNNTENNEYIIQLIETELQLIREIKEIEKGINNINKQYSILSGIYKRIYQNTSLTDKEQINIQGALDNLNNLTKDTIEQEEIISNLIHNKQLK